MKSFYYYSSGQQLYFDKFAVNLEIKLRASKGWMKNSFISRGNNASLRQVPEEFRDNISNGEWVNHLETGGNEFAYFPTEVTMI